jgi:Mn2+/Fe2+ NRAMP family transporter
VTTITGTPTRASKSRSRRRRLGGVLAVLAIFGPGLISANAGNDAGGILTYASAGADFGYQTLFLMVLITVGLVVVQEMCSRLGVYTGKGVGGLLREQFSVRNSSLALVLLVIANAGLTVSEFAGVGAAFQIFGVSPYISVPVAALTIWVLTVFGSYSKAERLFLVLSLAFLAYPIAAFMGHPYAQEVFSNLLWPHFPAYPRVPSNRCRPGGHDHHAVHAVLRGLRCRGQRGTSRRLRPRASGHGQRRHLE